MSEARRTTFRALLSCYHNSFANVREGRVAHSPEFVQRVLQVCEAKKARALLAADPRLTSTDEGAIAVGIARAVMTSERASRSFIDIEINEAGTYVVTFDKDLKPDDCAAVVSSTGSVAVLCKPDDKLGEGVIADCTLLLIEPTAVVAESMVKAEKDLIAEGRTVKGPSKPVTAPPKPADYVKSAKPTKYVESSAQTTGQPGLQMTVNGITYQFDPVAGWKLADTGASININTETGLRDLMQALRADVPLVQTPAQSGTGQFSESKELSAADVKALYCFVYGEKSFGVVGEKGARKALVTLMNEAVSKAEKILGEKIEIPAGATVEDLADELSEAAGDKIDAVVALLSFDAAVPVSAGQLKESFENDLHKTLLIQRSARNLLLAVGSVPDSLSESFEKLVAFIKKAIPA